MTNESDWKPIGEILYTDTHKIPRLKITTDKHVYEIQEFKFHPIMKVFSVLIDGSFHTSVYDSLDRLLKLDEVSKSGMCSEREDKLQGRIKELEREIEILKNERDRFERNYNDERIIRFDSV